MGELREKVSQLEQDKLSAELRLTEVVQQLDERNAEIVSMKERLCNNMNTPAPEEPEVEQALSEEPQEQTAANQELIKMVKEVAQQQELGELKELEEGDDDDSEEEKHGFWGSKVGKRFGLF